MLTCLMSSCDHAEQPDVGRLAAHLAEVHVLAPSEAIRRAREVREMPPTPKEARPMPNATYTCPGCGATGHNARSSECPEKGKPAAPSKACGYCKHTDHVYADCPMAQARRKGKKRKPFMLKTPKPAEPKTKGFSGALMALRAEHADLTAAISALERLEARGR